MRGAKALMEIFLKEGVDTVFGYPGGQIMAVYDELYEYRDLIRHVLVRHEQGAVHAAQGYARQTGKPGVVIVTSGPGSTNVVTGIVDAMMDSTPLVVIAGQVRNSKLGTDGFQEADFLGMTLPVSKWGAQVKNPEDIPEILAKAFYIARTGHPGPVVIVLTHDAQNDDLDFEYERCSGIRTYRPLPEPCGSDLQKMSSMIAEAKKPFLVYGQGIMISGAEKELETFLAKTNIPAGSTMLGLSALPSDCPQYTGMLGMHGNLAPNWLTQQCDLLIAVGMRFDDRVTGVVEGYSPNSRKIHIDIDSFEINKVVDVDLGVVSDAKVALERLIPYVSQKEDWWSAFAADCRRIEIEKIINPEVRPEGGTINMGEVVDRVATIAGEDAVIVTDVGQNQMCGARYSRFKRSRSFISSGGSGTMGFGLPAAIGAKIASPDRTVCLFTGDGGLQMTIQEFGTILQEGTGVKIILLNNNWLGNVRQWQQLFFGCRYASTAMINPDFNAVAAAYGIASRTVEDRAELEDAIRQMLSDDKPFLLNVHVTEMGLVFPMVPSGKTNDSMLLNDKEWFEYGK